MGSLLYARMRNEVIELANKIAPEHLELMVGNAKSLSKKITGAGLLLIGKNTPSAASDYILGTNHILPTNGFGRTRGGLSVLDFLKLQTVVESNKIKISLELQEDSLKALTDAEELTKPLQGGREEIRLNKEFQKKLNELSKLSGYEKPKKISGSLKLDSNENFVIGKQFQFGSN